MKNSLILLTLLSSLLMNAQAYSDGYNNHEFRFNMGRFLVTTTIEGSYEYYLTPETSIGGTIFFNGDALGRTGNFGIGYSRKHSDYFIKAKQLSVIILEAETTIIVQRLWD